MAKIALKCEKCGKKLELDLSKGVMPTGQLYNAAAKSFGFVETQGGYVCRSCAMTIKKG